MDLGTSYCTIKANTADVIKGFQQLGKEAKQVPLDIEKSWQHLGVASEKMFDTMRQQARNAYDRIVSAAETTAKDRLKAEEALNRRLQALDEAQFGRKLSLLDKLKKHWLGITAVVMGTYYAVKKLVEMVSSTTLAAARYETLGVVLEVVGRNAGYTTAELHKYASALEKTGISMTESRQQLTRMAQAQIDLSKATELGRIAQDAAVIGMIDSSQAFARMIYGIQTAQPEILRNIGLTVSFESAYKEFAATLGKSAGALTQQEKTQARLNAVMEQGKQIAGTYEAAMGTASKLLSSMVRQMANLTVQIGDLFLPSFTVIMDAVYKGVSELNKFLENNREKIQRWGAEIGLVFVDIAIAVLTVVQTIISGIETLLSFFKRVKDALGEVYDLFIKPFIERSKEIKKSTDELTKGIEIPTGQMGEFTSGMYEANQAIQEGGEGMTFIAQQAEEARKKGIELGKTQITITDEVEETGKEMGLLNVALESLAKSQERLGKIIDGTAAKEKAARDAKLEAEAKEKRLLEERLKREREEEERVAALTLEWEKVGITLQDEILKSGMDPIDAKIFDAEQKAKKLLEQFDGIPGAEATIFMWLELITKELKKQKELIKTIGYTQEQLTAISTVYEGLKEYSADYAKIQADLIDQQGKAFLDLFKDEEKYAKERIAIEKYVAKKKQEIWDAHYMKYGSIIDMMDVRYRQYTENMMSASQVAFEAISAGIEKLQQDLDDNLFNFLTGEFDAIEWDWEDLWHSMLRVVTKYVAQMIAEMVVMQRMVRPILSGILSGGITSTSSVGGLMGLTGSPVAGGGSGIGITDAASIYKLFGGSFAGAGGWGLGGFVGTGPVLGPGASIHAVSSWTQTGTQFQLGAVNWGNVLAYAGIAYNIYNGMKSIEEGKWGSAAGTAIGTVAGAFTPLGPIGAAIGGSIGNLVGGIIDNIFGFGEHKKEFTLSEYGSAFTTDVGAGGKAASLYKSGRGLALMREEYPDLWGSPEWVERRKGITDDDNAPWGAVSVAYYEGRDQIAQAFNEQMEAFLEILPDTYVEGVLEKLESMDFTFNTGGRWEYKNAEAALKEVLTNYGNFLDGKFNEVLQYVSKRYFKEDIATSDLFEVMTEEAQSQVEKTLTGNITGEEFQEFLTNWGELENVLKEFNIILDPTIAQMSTYDAMIEKVGGTFDGYIAILERVGIDIEKLIGSEEELAEKRQAVIDREIKTMQDAFTKSFETEMFLKYSDASKYEKELFQLNQEFDAYIESAKDLGLTEAEIAEIEEWRTTAVEALAKAEKDYLEQQKKSVENLVSLAKGMSADDIRMTMIAQRYNWKSSTYGTPETGYNWSKIIGVYQKGFTLDDLKRIADTLGIDWTTIADDIEYLVNKFWALKGAADNLKGSIEDQYYAMTMTDKDYGIYKAAQQREETLKQLRELYDEGFYTYNEYQSLVNKTWTIFNETVDNLEGVNDSLRDSISEAENAAKSWGSLLKALDKEILGLRTGSDNPADIYERLAIAQQAIMDYTGGLGLSTYLANLGDTAEQQEAIQDLMGLYNEYLALSQEAYQRPSSEYQQIYEDVMGAFLEMQDFAKSEYDYWETQLDYLRQIAENTNPEGSYQSGTEYVPKTGLYRLHRGERVIPEGEVMGDVHFTLNLNGTNITAKEARQEFEGFLRSNVGRKMVRDAARGH